MNLIKILSANADVYDGLADVYGIDLSEHDTLTKLKLAIASKLNDAEQYDRMDEGYTLPAELAMIKGFIDSITYMQSPEAEMDDFHTFIWENANETYEPIAGKPFPIETMKMFIGLEIENTDDLSDDGGEFDELEYEALDEALTTWESFKQRDEMERQVR